MIIQFILGVLSTLLTTILGIIPNLPDMPTVITDGIVYLKDIIMSVVGLFSYLYTPALFIFGITAVYVVLNFKNVYHLVMFIVHKLPIGTK